MTEPEQPKAKKARYSDRGIAILMVLICLAVLLPFTASFNYRARVDWQSAINHGDEIKARNIQRGAIQLSELLFILQREVFNQKQFKDFVGSMDITQVAPYMMSMFGSSTGAEEIGGVIGAFMPIELDTSVFEDLALPEEAGGFEYRVEAESGKLNVNCLAERKDDKNDPRARVVEVMQQFMAPTLYNPLFEEEKSNGQRYTRLDVLTGIVDYIDEDRTRYDVVNLKTSAVPETYRYTELYDPYQPRNARIDSIDELHLVEGVDDDWMAAFGDELTVYGGCKVNINFASAQQIAMVIRHAASNREKWKTEGDNYLLMVVPLANFIVEQREFNTLFSKMDDVRDMIKQPDQNMNPLMLLQDDGTQNNLPRVPDGIEVRTKGGSNKQGDTWGGLNDVATVSPERIYRIEIITSVGAVRKRTEGVYDLQYPRSQISGKGAWVYLRED